MNSRISIGIMICVLLISGCVQEQEDAEQQQITGILKGVSLSPKSFEQDDFLDFFEKAEQAGDVVMWAGDWKELGDEGTPNVVAELASSYGYIPLVEVSHYSQSEGKLLRPLDEATKQNYKNDAVAFAGKYKPEYLGFGIEINVLYENSPEDFDEFVQFYDEIYDAVKAKSPQTRVFTNFQLEKMKGLTFWSTNPVQPGKAQWFLIDRFKSDIITFSTYPCLVCKDPSEILPDHYTEIRSHTSKPVAFTEIGWHSEASPPGWESSEAEQAAFIGTFFRLTKDLNMEFAIWSFMHDSQEIEPFRSMGLRRSDGTAKPSWDAWLKGGTSQ